MSADAGDAAVDSAVPVDYILALEDPTTSLGAWERPYFEVIDTPLEVTAYAATA